jgi:hemoglobin
MNQEDSLYDRLGGKEKIEQMVGDFYSSIMDDDSINHFFKEVDMDRQINHQTNFLSFVTDGPNHYTGRTIAKAHEGVNATSQHFDSIIDHLRNTMEKHQINESEIESLLQNLSTYKKDIVSE